MKTTVNMSGRLVVLIPERAVDRLDAEREEVIRKYYGGRANIKKIEDAAIATWEAHERSLERDDAEAKELVVV